MTRPDPGSPDPGANQDDAVWLDLVARLEGISGPEADESGNPAGGSAASRPFSDFDPLGLSGAPPVELSARERLALTPESPAAPGPQPSAGSPGSPGFDGGDAAVGGREPVAGPRDYEAEDDDGTFVPEDPPSLAGADPMTVLAWLGAVGGPIALMMSAMFWRSAPLTLILGIVAAFAASVIFLIMKLPGEKDENDDGARL